MRHASAQLTLDTYAHLMLDDVDKAREYMARMVAC
jgi:hypothetical protein